MKKIILFSVLISLTLMISSFVLLTKVERLTMDMTMREVQKGMSYTINAELLYTADGKIITHFKDPVDYYLITSATGEYQIFNPKQNSVTKGTNPLYSSNQTQLSYFLGSGQNDLGLKEMGFLLSSSKIENSLLIKEYKSPVNFTGDTKIIELVHEKDKPIFMGAKNDKGEYVRKTYYYKYIKIGNKNFPSSITEISYADGDSSVSKISYSNIQINNDINRHLLDFKIPENAKVSK